MIDLKAKLEEVAKAVNPECGEASITFGINRPQDEYIWSCLAGVPGPVMLGEYFDYSGWGPTPEEAIAKCLAAILKDNPPDDGVLERVPL